MNIRNAYVILKYLPILMAANKSIFYHNKYIPGQSGTS